MNEPQGFNYCKGQLLCIEINRLNTKQFKSYMLELEFEFELDFELDFELYFELQKQQKKLSPIYSPDTSVEREERERVGQNP